jgi:hypothetical protein
LRWRSSNSAHRDFLRRNESPASASEQMLFEKCLHFFLEIQPILRVLEAMAFVHFQIVDALKANGKRREIDRVDVGMKRIGAEKMEVSSPSRSCSNNT